MKIIYLVSAISLSLVACSGNTRAPASNHYDSGPATSDLPSRPLRVRANWQDVHSCLVRTESFHHFVRGGQYRIGYLRRGEDTRYDIHILTGPDAGDILGLEPRELTYFDGDGREARGRHTVARPNHLPPHLEATVMAVFQAMQNVISARENDVAGLREIYSAANACQELFRSQDTAGLKQRALGIYNMALQAGRIRPGNAP